MSKRNGTVTDSYDGVHRGDFTGRARKKGYSRQWARYQWARRVRGAKIAHDLNRLFDAVSAEMAKGETP